MTEHQTYTSLLAWTHPICAFSSSLSIGISWGIWTGCFSTAASASQPASLRQLLRSLWSQITSRSWSVYAAQSSAEQEVDLNLIDLWSMDPVPTEVPTLESSSSLPVLSGDLPLSLLPPDFLIPPSLVMPCSLDPWASPVSSSSSALPPLLALCSSATLSWASRPLTQRESESQVAPQPSRPMSPPQPVNPVVLPGSTFRHFHRGLYALGLLCALSSIRTNLGRSFSFHHGFPGLQLHLEPPPCRLPWASPFLWFPCHPHSLHHCPSQANPSLNQVSQLLHLGLPGHRWYPGPSAPRWRLGLHCFRLHLR